MIALLDENGVVVPRTWSGEMIVEYIERNYRVGGAGRRKRIYRIGNGVDGEEEGDGDEEGDEEGEEEESEVVRTVGMVEKETEAEHQKSVQQKMDMTRELEDVGSMPKATADRKVEESPTHALVRK